MCVQHHSWVYIQVLIQVLIRVSVQNLKSVPVFCIQLCNDVLVFVFNFVLPVWVSCENEDFNLGLDEG